MADMEKIVRAWERCKVCNMSPIGSEEGHKAYVDCEYTTGLYCRKDRLIDETIELMKEQRWHDASERPQGTNDQIMAAFAMLLTNIESYDKKIQEGIELLNEKAASLIEMLK